MENIDARVFVVLSQVGLLECGGFTCLVMGDLGPATPNWTVLNRLGSKLISRLKSVGS
jgi:hypothetical protein